MKVAITNKDIGKMLAITGIPGLSEGGRLVKSFPRLFTGISVGAGVGVEVADGVAMNGMVGSMVSAAKGLGRGLWGSSGASKMA